MKSKDYWLTIRLSQSDLNRIKEKAHSADMNVSEYVRLKCLSDSTKPSIVVDRKLLSDLLIALKRIGNNINQLTRYVHSRRLDGSVENSLVQALDSLTQISQELSQFLIDSRNNL